MMALQQTTNVHWTVAKMTLLLPMAIYVASDRLSFLLIRLLIVQSSTRIYRQSSINRHQYWDDGVAIKSIYLHSNWSLFAMQSEPIASPASPLLSDPWPKTLIIILPSPPCLLFLSYRQCFTLWLWSMTLL